jgi:hypothetical protein
MEGTFLTLERSERVPVAAFHNPSIRDFVVDWLAKDEVLLAALLRCAVFFEQMRQLYSFANPYFGDDNARPTLKELLGRFRDEFITAIERTLHGPSPERRIQWIHHHGNVHKPPVGWFEERMLFCLGLPTLWRPNENWLLEQITTLADRWQQGEGGKAKAVELMRELEWIMWDAPADGREEREELVRQAGTSLDSWLRSSLDESEEDWAPYIDRFEHDHDATLAADRPLVKQFEKFVNDEFDRWSPSPPNLEMLLAHAKKLNACSEVQERIRDAIREDDEQDRETAEQLKPTTPPTQPPWRQDSDEELGRLFQRLLRT